MTALLCGTVAAIILAVIGEWSEAIYQRRQRRRKFQRQIYWERGDK